MWPMVPASRTGQSNLCGHVMVSLARVPQATKPSAAAKIIQERDDLLAAGKRPHILTVFRAGHA